MQTDHGTETWKISVCRVVTVPRDRSARSDADRVIVLSRSYRYLDAGLGPAKSVRPSSKVTEAILAVGLRFRA
jgi:hypothetical protein